MSWEWLVFGGAGIYFLGWFLSAMLLARGGQLERWGCNGKCSPYATSHSPGCRTIQRKRMTPGEAASYATFWPISVPYQAVIWAGTRPPKTKGLTEAEIARLDAVLEGKEEL